MTPDTILRWHRQLIAQKWAHPRRSMGRPRTMREIADLVVRMARESSLWGYSRIQGALENLGHRVGRTTIASILKLHGIEPAPEREAWMMQVGRNLTDPIDGFLRDKTKLIYAERFVRSIKTEGLSRMIFCGERSLRKATREYAAHYHRERNHQGLDNRLIDAADDKASAAGAVECFQRLGGMLRFYNRVAV